MNFIAISTGIYDERFMKRCVESLSGIDHHVIIADNAPQDKIIVGDEFIRCCEEQYGAMRNFIRGMKIVDPHPEDVILRVDLDDQIAPGALDVVKNAYKDPNCLLTYGSSQYESGAPARFQGAYTGNNFRTGKFRSFHLFTFKAKLFKHLRKKDFKDRTGNYFKTCCDLVLGYGLMELAGQDRIRHIPEITYIYNDLSPFNDHKLYKLQQKHDRKIIQRQSVYKRVRI